MSRILSRGWTIGILAAASLAPLFSATAQTSFPADGRSWEGDQRIEEALARRGSAEFKETPLHEVLQALSRQFEVQMVLAMKKLDEASVPSDTPVTKQLENLTLESILRLTLKDLELDFVVRNEVLMITTPEDVESQLQARVYPVHDLVAVAAKERRDAQAEEKTDYDSLINVIVSSVQPDSWDDVGGPGSIEALPTAGALTVSQTRDVHRSIEGLLMALRHVKEMQGLGAAPPAGRASTTRPANFVGKLREISQAEARKEPRIHNAQP